MTLCVYVSAFVFYIQLQNTHLIGLEKIWSGWFNPKWHASERIVINTC